MKYKIIAAISFCSLMCLGGAEGPLFPYLNIGVAAVSIYILHFSSKRIPRHDSN